MDLPKFGLGFPGLEKKEVVEITSLKTGITGTGEVVTTPKVVKATEVIADRESGFDTAKNKILKAHGGLESNIPVNSPYWRMK